jgi:hypothetical protein
MKSRVWNEVLGVSEVSTGVEKGVRWDVHRTAWLNCLSRRCHAKEWKIEKRSRRKKAEAPLRLMQKELENSFNPDTLTYVATASLSY